MKKEYKIVIGIVALLLLVIVIIGSMYNSIVEKAENVDNLYSNIEVNLERRIDLIPNLVNTVKGYTNHEEKIISQITDARTKLINSKNMEEKAISNDELSSALNALMVVVENYPDLKSNQNFIQLSDELAGTENRIAVSRKDYNEAVKEYNSEIIKFPKNIIASIFNFEKKNYFEAKESAHTVPEVNFE